MTIVVETLVSPVYVVFNETLLISASDYLQDLWGRYTTLEIIRSRDIQHADEDDAQRDKATQLCQRGRN